MQTNLTAQRVAAEVRAAMARRQISQTKLVELVGKSQSYWSRRLSGEVAFDIVELAAISAALDVTLSSLVDAA